MYNSFSVVGELHSMIPYAEFTVTRHTSGIFSTWW